ncbi:MAG: molybdenum cofactor guanylyltransferase [Prolixibacteraceae bacterium]|nr:molybdenum cofactor guanylyltransferase [Prolixibacteraceae bacterium]
MKQKKGNISGGILAGGKSSRMGTEKGLQTFKGKSLILYSVEALKPFCTEFLISSNNISYHQFKFPLVKDVVTDCGPLGGLLSLLKKTRKEYLFLLACDMPFVTSETIKSLFEGIGEAECIVPKIGNKMEPLCAIYSKSLIPEIEKQITTGDYSMHTLIMNSSRKFVHFAEESSEFKSINVPEDLVE